MVNKLYQLDCEALPSEMVTVESAQQDSRLDTWHGHASEQCVKNTAYKQLATGIQLSRGENLSFCEACIAGKMQRKPFSTIGEIHSMQKLQLIHSDVCGPMPTESIGGNKYFVTFIDDYSRCCAVYFLKSKSEILEKFKQFEMWVSNDCSQKINSLQSDNGGEYLSQEFESYLKSKGIHHELTVPHSPEQNGVAERMNRTLMESARSMMAHAGLPERFWAEAVECAAYIRNRMPTTAIKGNKVPMEVWSGKKADVSHLKVFGCIAYAHIPDALRNKLDDKAVKFRFVGYSTQSMGYRLLDEKTSRVYTRRDVIFNEKDFGHENKRVSESPETVEVNPRSTVELEEESQPPDVQERRPERTRRHPIRFGIDEYADTAVPSDIPKHMVYSAYQIPEPVTMDSLGQ